MELRSGLYSHSGSSWAIWLPLVWLSCWVFFCCSQSILTGHLQISQFRWTKLFFQYTHTGRSTACLHSSEMPEYRKEIQGYEVQFESHLLSWSGFYGLMQSFFCMETVGALSGSLSLLWLSHTWYPLQRGWSAFLSCSPVKSSVFSVWLDFIQKSRQGWVWSELCSDLPVTLSPCEHKSVVMHSILLFFGDEYVSCFCLHLSE